jgi:regulator of protease activity HflC (stomatin/prohibitin superfamily)
MSSQQQNSYLGEVLEQQQKVDLELKARKRSAPPAQLTQAAGPFRAPPPRNALATAPEPADGGGHAVEYKITGWGRWKTVVVPPNAYVVHTRRGAEKPLHIGMGVSFRYNPYVDAFLVIPAAMQTIVINARCICLERQGILVQAYVQWIIDDIATAYRKLDFSDAEDPMRVVNVQLREQAEAAIKDKVATMRIDEVLADKQPIIEELTHRLRQVAEGSRQGGNSSGLGLKIVTVQIKEAVVSSTHLWENLQKPFRADRERLARMAELETERQVAARELEIRRAREAAELEAERALARNRAEAERETYDREQSERARRARVEQEAERAAILDRIATEKARRDAELDLALKASELARQKVDAEIAVLKAEKELEAARAERARVAAEHEASIEELKARSRAKVAEQETASFKARRAAENDVSENLVRSQLIASLPELASRLPVPKELRSVTISGDGAQAGTAGLAGLLAGVMALVEPPKPKGT